MKLSAVRTEAEGENPGKTTIMLNDGTAQDDTVVEILDGQVTPKQMNAAIAELAGEKQDTLTFDDIPTAESDNPVKSGGVHGAVKEVADAVTEHVGNMSIHVTAEQKTAWTAKYGKPQDGIPKSDLNASVQASLGRADTAVQVHQSLDAYVNAAGYDSTAKEIQLKHDSTVVARIDATAFIKDGMVSSVAISNGYLVITFNTDAGTSPVSIALTDIFNPANYYDKTAADGRFVQKETGKGLVSVDASLTTQGAAADAKAVGDALRSGFTPWETSVSGYGVRWDSGSDGWVPFFIATGNAIGQPIGDAYSTYLEWAQGTSDVPFSATRSLITPTKTSQLVNDGAPNGDGTPYATTAQIPVVTGKADKVLGATAGNLASLDSSGNIADSGVKPSDFAAKSDLPYRLVEPGEWEFSGVPARWDITDISYELGDWTITYLVDEAETDVISTQGAEDALSLTFAYSDEIHITATRPSLPGHLCDRAGNRVVVTGATTLTLPALVNAGKARDFLVKVTTSADDLNITWQGQESEAPNGADELQFVTEDGDFPVVGTAGDYLFSFTEIEPHKFAVSMKPIVSAPQAQGGS